MYTRHTLISPPMAKAAVHSKVVALHVVVDLLLLPLFVGVLCWVLVLLFITLCPSSFAISQFCLYVTQHGYNTNEILLT